MATSGACNAKEKIKIDTLFSLAIHISFKLGVRLQ